MAIALQVCTRPKSSIPRQNNQGHQADCTDRDFWPSAPSTGCQPPKDQKDRQYGQCLQRTCRSKPVKGKKPRANGTQGIARNIGQLNPSHASTNLRKILLHGALNKRKRHADQKCRWPHNHARQQEHGYQGLGTHALLVNRQVSG